MLLCLTPPRRPRFDDHLPTRPVDREKAENELSLNIKKATSTDETSPKQKHVRSTSSLLLPALKLTFSHRVHRVHMGLSHVYIDMERSTRAAHPKRRSADVQGAHPRPQGLTGGPPHCSS